MDDWKVWLAFLGTLQAHPWDAYPRRPASKYPRKANHTFQPSWLHHVSHWCGRARATSKEETFELKLWFYSWSFILNFLLIFYTREKRDAVKKVARRGWFCSGISRQDAEDKRPMDGLEASTAKPTTPRQLLNLYITFERQRHLLICLLWWSSRLKVRDKVKSLFLNNVHWVSK